MPKRILILIDSLYGGGAEKSMLTLALAMNALGHDAQLLILSKNMVYQPDCIVHCLYNKKVRLKGRKNGQVHAEQLRQKVAELEASDGSFDLILANLEETYRITSMCGFSHVFYVIHNSLEQTLKRTLRMGPFKYIYLKRLLSCLNGKHLIAVSRGVETEIKNGTLIEPASIQTVYNPFDVEEIRRLSQQPEANLPVGRYIVHLGRAARQKRHDILFDSLRHVNPDVKLVCLSSDTAKLRKLAKAKGVSDRVILPGFQRNPYPWIKAASLLVSCSDYEGFCNALVEAMICGTVPISTNCPHGPNEILCGELASLLVPVRDSRALAQKIEQGLAIDNIRLQTELLSMVEAKYAAQSYLDLAEPEGI